ncbi:MAG: hypothetical protein Q9227_008428 [Pyrenula ochraceoflavens]
MLLQARACAASLRCLHRIYPSQARVTNPRRPYCNERLPIQRRTSIARLIPTTSPSGHKYPFHGSGLASQGHLRQAEALALKYGVESEIPPNTQKTCSQPLRRARTASVFQDPSVPQEDHCFLPKHYSRNLAAQTLQTLDQVIHQINNLHATASDLTFKVTSSNKTSLPEIHTHIQHLASQIDKLNQTSHRIPQTNRMLDELTHRIASLHDEATELNSKVTCSNKIPPTIEVQVYVQNIAASIEKTCEYSHKVKRMTVSGFVLEGK